eukprot:scaffold13358_cov198-Alexandrium_tamarense.AAC.20
MSEDTFSAFSGLGYNRTFVSIFKTALAMLPPKQPLILQTRSILTMLFTVQYMAVLGYTFRVWIRCTHPRDDPPGRDVRLDDVSEGVWILL